MALNLKINGGSYVSDTRKAAFEKALQEKPVAQPAPQVPVPVKPELRAPEPVAAQPSVVVDYGSLLSSLDKGLAMSFDHQEDTLRVHEQYLRNQAEYASIFSQLMEQQSQLFSQGASAPAEALSAVLQTLGRSIEQFHAHQGDTLDVHNSFLQQQSEYSREFVALLRQQYSNMAGQTVAVSPTPGPSVVPVTQPARAAKIATPAPQSQPQPIIDTPAPVIAQKPVAQAVQPVASSSVDLAEITTSLLEIVSEKTGYPSDMLELDMDMEADLGIDSIKRVEILGALQDAFPTLPEIDNDALTELRTLAQIIAYMEDTTEEASTSVDVPTLAGSPDVIPELAVNEPVSGPATTSAEMDADQLQTALLDIVSEKTGYPADMLELDMDMEADLGIDSIKRVEILGAMQDAFPSLPELGADELAELRTLAQIKQALNAPVEVALKKV